MKWRRIVVGSAGLILALASMTQAKTFCMVKVHGKGAPELAQPDNYWAEDYWANGQFQAIAQPCRGMPTLTTHADGTFGQQAAFDQQYCGCGIVRQGGCDYTYTPQAGKTDPGINGPWPTNWWNGWVNTTNANSDNPDPTNQCIRSGPFWPRVFPTPPRYQGVLEQIYNFIQANGCDDVYIVTHSNGGNVIRFGFSYTQMYTMSPCHQGNNNSNPVDPGCARLRQHQIAVINATSTVITLAAPSTGSEAANVVQTITNGNYAWMTGWIAEWLGTPFDRATQELTTSAMLARNTNFMYGTRNPLRQWPTMTTDGIPLRVARWIAIVSSLNATNMVQDAAHPEDYELVGSATVVPFAGTNDGLVTYASATAVYTYASDVWLANGQHDQAAAASFSGPGNNGDNHHHSRLGAGGGLGWWRPGYWRQENTTPMRLSWPGPAFPPPGGPGLCNRVRIGTNPDGSTVDRVTCPSWPVPSYASHGVAVPACPDAICQSNETRGHPSGADEAFWISAFIGAKAAAYCGPAITNRSVYSGQWTNSYANTLTCGGNLGFGCQYGPQWQLVGQNYIYNSPYAPDAGEQVCQWQC